MQKPWDLRERTISFSVSVIRFCRQLPRSDEAAEIAKQLRRSASSIGAHYCAAARNKSDADYINKITGGIEEGDETTYWFDVLARSDISPEDVVKPLRGEANELVSILVTSRETARARVRAARDKRRTSPKPE